MSIAWLLDGLNDRQREVVLHDKGPLLVVAGAGSGKTSTVTRRIVRLIEQKHCHPEEILAITFTNKAAGEIRERVTKMAGEEIGKRANLSTFHALSAKLLRGLIGQMPSLKRTNSFEILDRSGQTRELLRIIKDMQLDPKEHKPSAYLSEIQAAKGSVQFPWEYDYPDVSNPVMKQHLQEVAGQYERRLRALNALDFGDLLMWTTHIFGQRDDILAKVAGAYKFIMVDEYQDTNPVQLLLLDQLTRDNVNIAVVGDDAQCLIEGSLITMGDGAVKPIEAVVEGETVMSHYGRGHQAPAVVAKAMKRWHDGHVVEITLANGAQITSTPEHTHFADYKHGTAPEYFFTYLMQQEDLGGGIGTRQMYGGGSGSVAGYRLRAMSEAADNLWIIGVHASENEARLDEYITSLKYQIPTLPFYPRKGLSTNGLVHDAAYIARVFAAVDTETTGRALLSDLGLEYRHPHHRPRSRNSNRRNVSVTLCQTPNGRSLQHGVAIFGNDAPGRLALLSASLPVRSAKGDGWRLEEAQSDFADTRALVLRILKVFPDAWVGYTAKFGKPHEGNHCTTLPFIPAGSVLPGMSMFVSDGEYSLVKTVRRIPWAGWVYDLNVQGTHNYIADGVVTHNCIFSFAGANVQTILDFPSEHKNTKVVYLEQNYRSTQKIVDAANTLIRKNLKGFQKTCFSTCTDPGIIQMLSCRSDREEAQKIVNKVTELHATGLPYSDFAVLYRTNAQSRLIEEQFVERGIPYLLKGGYKFYDRSEVQDALSWMKLFVNPANDSAWERAISAPSRGIGDTTLAEVKLHAKASAISFFESLQEAHFYLKPAACKKVEKFVALIEKLRKELPILIPSSFMVYVLQMIEFETYIKGADVKVALDDADRWNNVKELVNAAKQYERECESNELIPTLSGFLERVALIADESSHTSETANRVNIMTAHSSKGLEYHTVFIAGCEETLFPLGNSDIEDERRLFYVALTRAKRNVFFLKTETRWVYGMPKNNAESRFIRDAFRGA